MTPQNHEELLRFRERFTAEILRQAALVVERHCEARRAALVESLRAFGVEASASLRVIEVWEDHEHGQLPPRIVAELCVVCHAGRLAHRVDVPIGAFHDNAKADQIFELCMLRAEADQELAGGGDGHVLDRMRELEGMIAAGRVVFVD